MEPLRRLQRRIYSTVQYSTLFYENYFFFILLKLASRPHQTLCCLDLFGALKGGQQVQS